MPRGTIHTSSVEAASESEAVQFVKAIHPDSEITELRAGDKSYQPNTARPDELEWRKKRNYDYTVRTLRGSIEKSRIEAESEAEAYRSVQAIYPGGHIMGISTTYKPQQPKTAQPITPQRKEHLPMATELKKALIYFAAVVIAALSWYAAEVRREEASRYSLWSAGPPGQTFLLDKKTGEIWRYYWNVDGGGNRTSEGFSSIFVPTSPPK